MNKSLFERTRLMMLENEILNYMWVKTISTSYLLNHCPIRTNNKVIKEKIFYRHKPYLAHLHIFGCQIFVHIPKEEKIKLQVKTFEGTMVGYDQASLSTEQSLCFVFQ